MASHSLQDARAGKLSCMAATVPIKHLQACKRSVSACIRNKFAVQAYARLLVVAWLLTIHALPKLVDPSIGPASSAGTEMTCYFFGFKSPGRRLPHRGQ
jgi:hypothetical protein